MVTIDVRYEGELRSRAVHGPSGSVLTTDAPVDNQGKGQSFSPTDLVATALGTCILTTMGIAAAKHRWDMTGATARVEKHMIADPERRIGKLPVEVHVPRDLGERARTVLERAAHTCPVHKSLDPRIEAPIVFRWGS